MLSRPSTFSFMLPNLFAASTYRAWACHSDAGFSNLTSFQQEQCITAHAVVTLQCPCGLDSHDYHAKCDQTRTNVAGRECSVSSCLVKGELAVHCMLPIKK